MKTAVLLFSLIFLSVPALQAQIAGSGRIKGQVVDNAREGIGFASAVLLQLPDSSIVTGAKTEDNGRFELNNVPPGQYALRISYLGYLTQTITGIAVKEGHTENLGVIILKKDNRLLDEVLVESSVPAVQYELDKTIFNVTDDIRAMSINATQILENIPMVELDENGVPSVMGQGVTVLIDGRPSRIYGDEIETVLKLIPAGTIKKVEVITNPSARYATEEGGIVLNIITKSEHLIGLSGMVSLSGNTNGGYSPAVSVNLTRKKFGWNNSFSFEYDRDPFESYLNRKNLLDTLFYTDQSRTGHEIDKDFSYNGNLYYEVTKNDRIGIFFGLGHDTENKAEKLTTERRSGEKELLSSYIRNITGHENSWQYHAGITYKKTFQDNEDHILDFEAYYSKRDDKDDELFDQQSEWEELNELKHHFTTSHDNGFTIDLDYVQPFSEKSRLEAGFRAEWETDDNDFTPKYFDDSAGKYLVNDTLRNDFISHDQEYSLYAMYRTEIKNFSLQAGLRLEKELLITKQHILDQNFHNEFLNLIPTLNVSYRFKNKDNISFSYTRRADRPWWRQLNPFVDYSDPENIRSGNPDLKPEFDNSFELRYGKFINQFSLYGAAFYRHTYHPIQRIRTINKDGISHMTYQNKGKENYFGVETGFSADIVPDWTVRTNIGIRRNEVLGFERQYSNWSFNGRFSSYFPLPWDVRGFAYVHYRGPRSVAQGQRDGMLYSDLGIRKSFFNKRGDISLRLSDVFNQRKWASSLITDEFVETSSHQWSSRNLSLTISYIFGKLEAGKDKNDNDQSTEGEREGEF